MYFIVTFFIALLLLFFLSRFVTKDISHLVFRLTRSQKASVYVLAFLFLPGTIIHEVSHYLVAQLLFVRTGEMEFMPLIHEDSVKLGSVQIEKTDPIRRAIIGVAPFLLGIALILFILFAAEVYSVWGSIWFSILIYYLLFEIGNTMFSSKKDMEGALELFAVIVIIIVILYMTGVRLPDSFFEFFSSKPVLSFFKKGTHDLAYPVGIDILFILITRITLKFVR